MKKYLFFMVLLLFFVSCSKPNDSPNENKKLDVLSKEYIENQKKLEKFANDLTDFKIFKMTVAIRESFAEDISKHEKIILETEIKAKAILEDCKSQALKLGFDASSLEVLEEHLERIIQMPIGEEYIGPSVTYKDNRYS